MTRVITGIFLLLVPLRLTGAFQINVDVPGTRSKSIKVRRMGQTCDERLPKFSQEMTHKFTSSTYLWTLHVYMVQNTLFPR